MKDDVKQMQEAKDWRETDEALGTIESPRILFLKGALFLLLGVLAGGILLAITPSLRVATLLAISVWAFCRAYYFAFYVVENYVDRRYRFAGLIDFARYLYSRRSRRTLSKK